MTKDFRFGVGLRVAKSLSSVQDEARRAEDLGFDVLHLPDHIGAPAPFPTLMAAAAATTTLRLGTFVLNACFYKPALLARDVQALCDLSGGRFELDRGCRNGRDDGAHRCFEIIGEANELVAPCGSGSSPGGASSTSSGPGAGD